ncbi:MAG TPA: PaeR7I family type II restriction endonuclease [Candidatus Paceibacterota bacterium]|nr:PaeR7I family type II restriction endonuclease [Candidatus Paceibacterota bacterium]
MTVNLAQYEDGAKRAVKLFWGNRATATQQQLASGAVDHGTRGAVTAGKNMDGFASLMAELVKANGLTNATVIHGGRLVTLPGFFRPTKQWDLLVLNSGHLVAALEFKSQVGSFGNNFNNRTEEAIGTAHDLWIAYREGAFGEQPKPFVGWLMLLEDAPGSRSPVNDKSPHFPLFSDFKNASYADRYNILCKKLVQEGLYTAASVLISPQTAKDTGEYADMSDLSSLQTFVATFAGHIAAEAARK